MLRKLFVWLVADPLRPIQLHDAGRAGRGCLPTMTSYTRRRLVVAVFDLS